MLNQRSGLHIEEFIAIEVEKLDTNWEMVALLISIEKFDSEWPSVIHREFAALDAFKIADPQSSSKIYNGVIDALAGNVDPLKVQVLADFKCLYNWYKTEMEIPNLVKCLIFKYLMSFVDPGNDLFSLISSELATSLLSESGYSWFNYFKVSYPEPEEINHWMYMVISDLRDAQQALRYKLDLYGAGGKLTVHEQLLIHIIENHKGITTGSIVKKVGKSEATVRRMLAKLRQRKLIVTFSRGRATFHRVLEVG